MAASSPTSQGTRSMPITVTCALGSGAQERPPALRAAVENGNAQMLQVRPGRDLLRPHGLGDELRRDDQGVPAMPVADQLGERRERGSALAGAERRDQKGGVALVQKRCGALLIASAGCGREGAFICRAAFALV